MEGRAVLSHQVRVMPARTSYLLRSEEGRRTSHDTVKLVGGRPSNREGDGVVTEDFTSAGESLILA